MANVRGIKTPRTRQGVPLGPMLRLLLAAVASIAAVSMAVAVSSDEVDTALIVAIDVSNSVDETALQAADGGHRRRRSKTPGVIEAIVGGAKGGILFSLVTWADQPTVEPAVDAHRQRGRRQGGGQEGARAAAPGRRVHLHGAHDAHRVRQDRAADPLEGRQGRARCFGRRPRQLQWPGADRAGARRARQVWRHGERLADPGGRRPGDGDAGSGAVGAVVPA